MKFMEDQFLKILLRLMESKTYTNNGKVIQKEIVFLKEFLCDVMGLEANILKNREGKSSLFSVLRGTSEDFVILGGHIDIARNIGDHRNHAYKIAKFNDDVVLIGRGASDMKGGLVSILMCLNEIMNLRKKIPVTLVITIFSDEEESGTSIVPLLKILKTRLATCKGAIFLEPTNVNWYVVGNLNYIGAKIFAWNALASSIQSKLEILNTMMTKHFNNVQQESYSKENKKFLNVVEYTKRFYAKIFGPHIIKAFDSLYTEIYNIQQKHNRVELVYDIISLRFGLRDVFFIFKKIKDALGFEKIDTVIYDYKPKTFTSSNVTICKCLEKASKSVLGHVVRPLITLTPGLEVCIRNLGIPAILYGPGYTVNIHSDKEFVVLSNISRVAHVVKDTLLSFKIKD